MEQGKIKGKQGKAKTKKQAKRKNKLEGNVELSFFGTLNQFRAGEDLSLQIDGCGQTILKSVLE